MESTFYKKLQRTAALLVIAFLMLAGGCQEQDDAADTKTDDGVLNENLVEVNYESSTDVITNPERGFMHTYGVLSEGDALSQTLLNNLKFENVSLILRVYYLDQFRHAPMSEAQLDLIETDFNNIRAAGLKSIIRFAYTNQIDGEDAPIDRVESHLDQLKPIVTANADIIPFVQAGFIGAWGEWHASTNNLTSLENKKRVLNKLLNTFPKSVMIQLRTPAYKKEIFEYSQAINESTGYGSSDIARVGFHNDCFMASTNDYGTYGDVMADKKYISDEAFFVPTGGETCPPSGIPAASCLTAKDEMSLLKWTYLNLDYYGPVLNGWRNDNCFDDFERMLGYRLLLKTASFPKELTSSRSLDFTLNIQNAGFAPVYLPKKVYLVLKSQSGTNSYEKLLNADLRKVVPEGNLELSESVSLSGIPTGTYTLHLAIKDNSETLEDIAAYRIQLANKNTWDSSTSLNNLMHSIELK